MVISTAGGLTLSRRLARSAATARQLEDAFRSGLPVEGRVETVVKGGFEIRIGGQRGFCPFSQIDIARSEPATHEGKVYTFRITEYGEDGRNIVVSRRAILEEEERATAEEVRKSIVEGAVLKGRVASVRQFGAFVELGGGVQGLLHVSEMSWARVGDPSQLVAPGDEITVKVLQVDAAKQKISLGLKQLAADPWSEAEGRYRVGQVVNGRVTRHTPFGAFVEIEPGIEGLAHASTFEQGDREWRAAMAPGTSAAFEIAAIDLAQRRIGLRPAAEAARSREEADDLRAHNEREQSAASESLGSLADKLRGALGRPKDR